MPLNRTWIPKVRWTTVAAGLIFGAIIHITAIFALPYMSENNAWLRIAQRLPVNAIQPLPLASPEGQVLPYMSPDNYYAMCRFDLTDGAVAMRIPAMGPLWSISLYDELAQNYYVITGSDVKRDSLELLLNKPRSETEIVDPAASSAKTRSESITVRVPGTRGLAVIRAPIEGVSSAVRTNADFQRVTCQRAG